MSRLFQTILVLSTLTVLTFGHSQLRCAKYNKATGACAAPIRNQGVSFMEEAHINNGQICQSPMTNPISAAYANGAGCPDYAPCPSAMGTYTPGEKFTIMWYARNHAVDNQNPGSIQLYLSPKESANQGSDVSADAMKQNMLCTGSYANCGGVNQDTTPCTLDCTMPSNTQAGIYTFWWTWPWQNGVVYSTCADIIVTGSSNPSTPATPSAPATPLTSGRISTSSVPRPLTTGSSRSTTGSTKSTTGREIQRPLTTSRVSTPLTTSRAQSVPVTTGAVQSAPSPQAQCTLGHMKCTSTNTFQTCGWSTSTLTGWGADQNCPAGLKCNPVQGNYVWCY